MSPGPYQQSPLSGDEDYLWKQCMNAISTDRKGTDAKGARRCRNQRIPLRGRSGVPQDVKERYEQQLRRLIESWDWLSGIQRTGRAVVIAQQFCICNRCSVDGAARVVGEKIAQQLNSRFERYMLIERLNAQAQPAQVAAPQQPHATQNYTAPHHVQQPPVPAYIAPVQHAVPQPPIPQPQQRVDHCHEDQVVLTQEPDDEQMWRQQIGASGPCAQKRQLDRKQPLDEQTEKSFHQQHRTDQVEQQTSNRSFLDQLQEWVHEQHLSEERRAKAPVNRQSLPAINRGSNESKRFSTEHVEPEHTPTPNHLLDDYEQEPVADRVDIPPAQVSPSFGNSITSSNVRGEAAQSSSTHSTAGPSALKSPPAMSRTQTWQHLSKFLPPMPEDEELELERKVMTRRRCGRVPASKQNAAKATETSSPPSAKPASSWEGVPTLVVKLPVAAYTSLGTESLSSKCSVSQDHGGGQHTPAVINEARSIRKAEHDLHATEVASGSETATSSIDKNAAQPAAPDVQAVHEP